MANEKRLIDANALLLVIEEELANKSPFFTTEQNDMIDCGLRIAATDIRHQPPIDAVEVVHGRWVCLEAEIGYFACSECDHRILRAKCNYCPNCGAIMMDGDGNG